MKHLTDKELIESTRGALKNACEAEVQVLKHFREIDERRLWVDAGSLYKYLAITFQLTEDQVYPRLQAMRMIIVVPEVEEKMEHGDLSLTNVLKAHHCFSTESKQRRVTPEEKLEVLESLENLSKRDAEKVLAEKYPMSNKPPEKIKPVAKNQNLIQFYVDDETLAQIEEQKAKYSHQMPTGRMEDLVKILIQIANRQPRPKKRVTIKTRSRHIPAEVRREMEKFRHEGCCHVDPTGRRCCSKHFLQLDHIHLYSRGGLNEVHNLRWMCGFHNRNRSGTNAVALVA